jgi:S1-C subfamily serine protease
MVGISKLFHLESRIHFRSRYAVGRTLILFLAMYLVTVSCSFGAVAPSPPANTELSSADILQKARPAVVKVIVNDAEGKPLSQGSGFFVSKEGIVVTNWHVIAGGASAKITREDGTILKVVGILTFNREIDFALLKVQGETFKYLPLGDSSKIRQGDRMLTLGSPEGLENSASEGIISSVRDLPDGGSLLQTTASVSAGSSGGPVLDREGHAIGIICFTLREGQALNFAIPINAIKPALQNAPKATPLPLKSNSDDAKNISVGESFLAGLQDLPILSNAPDTKESYEKALLHFKEAIGKQKDYEDAYFYVGYCLGNLLNFSQ